MTTNSFVVSNGQIIGPDGKQFNAAGINMFDNQISVGEPDAVLKLFPGINMIRLAVENLSDTPATLQPFINKMTSAGIVVEIEDHTPPSANNNVPTGSALTSELAWYSNMASAFANNPYVWFGTMNEPNNTTNEAAVANQEASIYSAVRTSGNSNPILLEQIGGYTTTGLPTANYASMTNVLWDTHYYGWISNYSTNSATVNSALSAQIANAQIIKTAEGVVPVIIGEYGVSATGQSIDPNADQVIAAAQGSGVGTLAWAYNAGVDDLMNGNTSLTAQGQEVAKFIAAHSAPPPPPTQDTLNLRISEDAYKGDAQFTVTVNGQQVGGAMTASALHSMGDSNVFTLTGNWGASPTVKIAFINDAYGGSPSTDRNLYVNSVGYDGTTYAGAALSANGATTIQPGVSSKASAPADNITVHLSEDAYQGNADFQLSIDGNAVTTPQAVTTLHSSGNWEDFSFAGNIGAGTHRIGVAFTNDAWGGSASTDRNLFVNGLDVNGSHYGSGTTVLGTNSTASFVVSTAH